MMLLFIFLSSVFSFFLFFFFFSSRRRHTRLTCDWSSDVCSSDLVAVDERVARLRVVGGSLRQPQEPVAVLLVGVRREGGVLRLGAGLDVAPLAVEDVLAGGGHRPGAPPRPGGWGAAGARPRSPPRPPP